MNTTLRFVLIAGFFVVMFIFAKGISDKKLELQYTLTWLGLMVASLILTLFPNLLSRISSLIGIAVPVNTLFFLGFCFSLILIYRLTIVVSKQSTQITRLTQEIALLKKEKKDSENKDKE